MKNNRLTTINQYDDVLYCGPRDCDSYRHMGLYAEDMDNEQIQAVLTRLYIFEEMMEDLEEKLELCQKN